MAIEYSTVVPSIFGTGLVALDLLVRPEDSQKILASAGGTCGNVLIIMAVLGWNSYPIARLGNCAAAETVLADLREWGLQLDYAQLRPHASTPVVVERLRRDANGLPFHSFSYQCPSCGQYLPSYQPVTAKAAEQIQGLLENATVIFLDRASKGALKLVETAARAGAIVIFEPSATRNQQYFDKILAHTHILKYSHDRFADLSDFSRHSKLLLEIQTLGRGGLRFRHRYASEVSGWRHLQAPPVKNLIDSCGAGDWCTAGLIYALCRRGLGEFKRTSGSKLLRALSIAQNLAAWNCQFAGARGGMYSLDVDQLSAALRDLVSINTLTMPTKEGFSTFDQADTNLCAFCKTERRKKPTLQSRVAV